MADAIPTILGDPALIEKAARRLAQYAKPTTSGCIEWTSTRNAFGHGTVSLGRTLRARAHRVAWALENRRDPGGLCVCHRCDNPPCINPGHLFLGTKKENTRDMMSKGRMSAPPVHWGDAHHARRKPETVRRGEGNGMARLCEVQVREISVSLETCAALAQRYAVGESTIHAIKSGRTWRHVTGRALPKAARR